MGALLALASTPLLLVPYALAGDPTAARAEPGVAAHAAGLIAHRTAADEPLAGSDLLHIEVALFDGVPLTEDALRHVRHEMEEVFGSIGVQVSWIDRVVSPVAHTRSLEFRVIIMPIQPTTWGFRPRAMGTVLTADAPHTVYVFFPTIVRTVRRLESSHYGRLGADCRLVARGIARVMAHEMLHVLAPDLPHTEEGLMRRAFNRNDLVLDRPPIDAEFANAVYMRLLAINLAMALGAESLDPPGEGRR